MPLYTTPRVRTKMRLIQLALHIIVIGILAHKVNATCPSGLYALTIIERCYNATYDLIRKGLADDIASGHLRSAIKDLVKFSTGIGKDKKVDKLSTVCVPAEFYSSLFSVRWTVIYTEAALDDMLMSISNSYYKVNRASGLLPTLVQSQIDELDSKWASIVAELDKPMHDMNLTNVQYPASIRHAFDEKFAEACSEWNKHASSTSKTATDGLRRMLYMAVQLIATGCDPNSSWQLVRHYVGLVSLGIRCMKVEGSALMIPDKFMQDYVRASLRIMNTALQDGVLKPIEPIPTTVFDSYFEFVYHRLSTFGAWGQSDSLFAADIVIKNMMSYVVLAVNHQVALATYVNNGTLSTTSREVTLSNTVRQAAAPDCESPNNVFNDLQCNVAEAYCHFQLASPSSWYENCCNVIVCTNAIQLAPTQESFPDCCSKCNQLGCVPAILFNSDLQVPSVYQDDSVAIHVYLNS